METIVVCVTPRAGRQEITEEVMEGLLGVVWADDENRLYIREAVFVDWPGKKYLPEMEYYTIIFICSTIQDKFGNI